VIIDGLSENTEYHYKAIAESIAYDSEASMENILENERNTEAIADSEVAMDKVTDSESVMDKVMADVMPRTKMLLSLWILDTMWSKEMASEKFWNKGIENLDWKMDIDFTVVNTLKVYIESYQVNREAMIYIDETEIYNDEEFDWKEVSLDVSGYSGVKTLELSYDDDEEDKDNLRIDGNIPDNYTGGKSITFYEDGYDGDMNVYYYGLRLEE